MSLQQLRQILRGFEDGINLNYLKNVKKKQVRRKKSVNQSIRKVQHCVSNTAKEQRCKKRTAHTNKCWIHLAGQDGLRIIKPSAIPNAGKGLFAWKKGFKKGSEISKYTGRRLRKNEIDKKYGNKTAEYAICNGDRCIDANYTTDGAARFANDARRTRFKNNAHLRGKTNFQLKAKKDIGAHQEIFTSYGREYWKSIFFFRPF